MQAERGSDRNVVRQRGEDLAPQGVIEDQGIRVDAIHFSEITRTGPVRCEREASTSGITGKDSQVRGW